MEFGRVSEDHYAGYVVEDSDLEYSECSEADRFANSGLYAPHYVLRYLTSHIILLQWPHA